MSTVIQISIVLSIWVFVLLGLGHLYLAYHLAYHSIRDNKHLIDKIGELLIAIKRLKEEAQ